MLKRTGKHNVPMRTTLPLLASCLIFLLACPPTARAQDGVRETRDVTVFVYLLDVEEVDSVKQNFVANFFAEFRWMDRSLAHPGPDSVSMDLDDIWYPRAQVLNEQRMVRTFPKTVEVRPDGEVIYRQRTWGGLSQPLELRDFPFDRQKLQITLVAVNFGSIEPRFIASPESGISDQLTIPDFEVTGWNFEAMNLPVGRNAADLTGLVFSLDIKRHTSYFTLKVILPLVLIVMMSWLVFWIDPSLAATQISVSVTAMLTLIAYRFAIGGMVPKLAFLTSLDYFVLGSTLLIFISLVEVVYTSWLSGNGQLEKARAIDAKARWVMPVLFVAVILESLVFRFGI